MMEAKLTLTLVIMSGLWGYRWRLQIILRLEKFFRQSKNIFEELRKSQFFFLCPNFLQVLATFITLCQEVIQKERRGDYLGKEQSYPELSVFLKIL